MSINKEETIIVSLSNGVHLGKKIAEKLQIKYIEAKTIRFADQETLVTVDSTVRNQNVYLVQSTSRPVNDNFMELIIALDMLRRASAKSITVIMPYYGYARQDRKANGREPITAKLLADIIQKAGANKVILMDIHAEQIQGFFDIPVDSLRASYVMFENYIRNNNPENLVIVSPDYGGVGRCRKLTKYLNAPLAIVDKRRPRPNEVEISNVLGDVDGKDCVLYDDIIDTGNTIIQSARLIKQKGAKTVTIMATHGIFSNNANEKFEMAFKENIIDNVYITNTINHLNLHPKIKVIDLSSFLADVINAHENHNSVTDIYYQYINKIKKS
jgi:ribose-phosphate pyrophosphokinase